jgi:hypothetical protein
MISSYRQDKSPFPSSGGALTPLRYIDVVLLAVGAPILLLMGVSATGYGVGAGAWLALRVLGIGIERYLNASADARREISVRLAYLLARVFLLALTVILLRRGAGRDAALTGLLVIVFAFTVQLIVSFIERPRSRR